MADALEQLKERLAEVQDLGKIARILSWDQQTKMPPAGTKHRAEQFGTLSRIAHEKFTDPGVGKLLDELRLIFDARAEESHPEWYTEPADPLPAVARALPPGED